MAQIRAQCLHACRLALLLSWVTWPAAQYKVLGADTKATLGEGTDIETTGSEVRRGC
jgi:hypothetical protein